jgi:glucose 1-dehydrogenase
MKAIAVKPGTPDSVHLAELDMPLVGDVKNGLGILIKVLKVGVDATDREINDAEYGNAPPGYDFLVLGHELFGIVEEVGPEVRKVGDYVTCTVRRAGKTIFDQIGRSDFTSDETYYERGINLLHGYLTEYVVETEEFVIRVPDALKHLHVLPEPMSCAAKAVEQAYEVQRRLKVWEPRLAFVTGSGQIGLLTTMALRLRGLDVYTLARGARADNLKADIVEGYGAHYVSTSETSLEELVALAGKPDIIVEATGSSQIAFSCMEILSHNGIMVWTSITGGDQTISVPSNKINLEWVLGNKALVGSVNANFRHFEEGISDMVKGEVIFPGTTEKILTHAVKGLDNYREMMDLLVSGKALKVFVDVA